MGWLDGTFGALPGCGVAGNFAVVCFYIEGDFLRMLVPVVPQLKKWKV
ncbi:MAG: hypothetical protein SXA11_12225 [Cyanobacteriota bacterium]|nr:hypothetical protein [Cyanobacteriota bacterium]